MCINLSGGIAPLANIVPNDISLDSAAIEIFDELTRIYGTGVIKSVTGSRNVSLYDYLRSDSW